MKNNITFVLVTYNEEKRVKYALKNFLGYGDIIIMDGGSTDRTQKIAESFGAKFFLRPERTKANSETFENMNFLKEKTETDWIYWGYVDNIAPKSLVEKMVEIANDNKFKIVDIPLYTYLWGNTNHYAHKGYSPLLYNKNYVDFSKNYIHGLGVFTGNKKDRLVLPNKEKYALKHFSTYDEKKFVAGYMKYAELESQEKFNRGEKFSLIKTIAAMLRYFLMYIVFGFKNGKLGLLVALNYAFYRLMTYTRLYELENNITLERIEENYSKKKEALLKDF